jgi:hypothetical protein
VKISIITPTTGNPFLTDCIESVRNQTYKNIEHLVIIDGRSRWHEIDDMLIASEFPNSFNEHICILPYPTGINRYNGHRVYGSATYFADGDYHIWLDEDNLLESNHVESLVKLTQKNKLDWAYSLRQIIDSKGNFICNDDCENLGKYKSVLNDHFVDVNCFFIRRELAVNISPIWYRQARPSQGIMEVDRALTTVLMHEQNKLKFDTNNDYTVKYRVGSTGISVKAEFFINGNAEMLKRYAGKLPWKQ